MWTGKFSMKTFIVSCAMLVPFAELMAQDETVYTAEYKFNYESETVKLSAITEPVGTSFSVSGRYKRSLRSSWKDRVYLDKNNVGKINFTNFKYEVKSVDFNVMAEPSVNLSSNIYTEIIDYSDNSYSENYRIGSIEGTYFHYNSFLDGGEFSSLLNGLKSMSMKQLIGALTTNTVYYQGANDNSTPTFKISYYEPSVYFTSSMPTQIEWGKTFDVSEFYKIDHKGAFDFTTTYESSDKIFLL